MKLYIKNMVCNRCKMIIKYELIKLGLNPVMVELGEIEIEEQLDETKKLILNKAIQSFGFELLSDKTSVTIEKIKNLVLELIHNQNNEVKTNLSYYLKQHMEEDYKSLNSLFSEVEGTTIEQYYIMLKTERIKELLIYDELTLNEIASKLNYSSVVYLSNQFKRVTGFPTRHFRILREKKRKIEDV